MNSLIKSTTEQIPSLIKILIQQKESVEFEINEGPDIELGDNELLRMIDDPFSPLTILSITAIITTISLFFCGIPICIQIYNRKSTKDISGFPFLMGFLGGSFWLRYGFLKSDLTMIIVNVVGVTLMMIYMFFYLYYSKPKTNFIIQMSLVFTIITVMLLFVYIYKLDSLKPLGFISMTFNILNFGAPLAGLNVVLRNRCCSTLPLPLCIANLLVSSQWCLYGVLVKDIFIIIPNGAGILLACVQMSLFLVLPPREGSHAPLAKCCPIILDLEKGEILDNENVNQRHRHRNGHKKKGKHVHPKLPCKKILERHYIIDRRVVPASRTACIEYFRGGYGRPFDNSFGSFNSRSTADSWLTNSLSRVSSISHPDLFNSEIYNDIQNGASNKRVIEVLTNDEMQQQQKSTNQRHRCHLNCGGSLLRSRISMLVEEPQCTSQINSQDEGFVSSSAALSISSRPTTSSTTNEYFGINGSRMLNNDRRLLTESDPGGGNYLLCRSLSAPDLQQIIGKKQSTLLKKFLDNDRSIQKFEKMKKIHLQNAIPDKLQDLPSDDEEDKKLNELGREIDCIISSEQVKRIQTDNDLLINFNCFDYDNIGSLGKIFCIKNPETICKLSQTSGNYSLSPLELLLVSVPNSTFRSSILEYLNDLCSSDRIKIQFDRFLILICYAFQLKPSKLKLDFDINRLLEKMYICLENEKPIENEKDIRTVLHENIYCFLDCWIFFHFTQWEDKQIISLLCLLCRLYLDKEMIGCRHRLSNAIKIIIQQLFIDNELHFNSIFKEFCYNNLSKCADGNMGRAFELFTLFYQFEQTMDFCINLLMENDCTGILLFLHKSGYT
ncbi:hypothetical protein Mgra_00009914 [Meloidogyne graminicola]|uniref:Sugar transporter SWEET1 n=1 Tax=Meloidogyne graminicola TaxID=189291 RepID=A0A8S9ZAI8_9BILA|nr:hypothetical protein Mgra_00009914 [Meloidogyne graminicola]